MSKEWLEAAKKYEAAKSAGHVSLPETPTHIRRTVADFLQGHDCVVAKRLLRATNFEIMLNPKLGYEDGQTVVTFGAAGFAMHTYREDIDERFEALKHSVAIEPAEAVKLIGLRDDLILFMLFKELNKLAARAPALSEA